MSTPAIHGGIRPSDWHLRSTLQDLFLLVSAMALAVLVAWHFDIFTSGYVTDPVEKKIEIDEALLLGLILSIVLFLFSLRRLAEQRREEARRVAAEERARQAEHLAMLDPLTGLPNRRVLSRAFEEVRQRPERGGATLAFMLIDLNGFKAINDRHGHPVGDRLLVVVAQRLGGALPREATLSRLGGDEFAVLCPHIAGREDAEAIARRLVEVIAEPIVLDGTRHAVSAAVGVAVCPIAGAVVDDLMRDADAALYAAKAAGGAAIRFAATPAEVAAG
ncbi:MULTISPECIES: GGDEF domain-containing protein [Chelatococcus]|uniref:Diguanylate cyclase (GGDEF)-like protein n=1 Tax=Chelatococcus caeni TaxID=1348468 RepID=A0A840BVR4_9HYPH|nr:MULTISPECIES: GGDEF domain-containing protein [unclassified Chelatococcus]MBB4017060.1 diguanylate cyclase (GGDEF)-like protein [Chelatococcus caeni]